MLIATAKPQYPAILSPTMVPFRVRKGRHNLHNPLLREDGRLARGL